MSKLKKQLIRLGKTNPELRDHIRPVLEEISKKASSYTEYAMNVHAKSLLIGGEAERVALAVGAMAKLKGWTEDQLKQWYQQADRVFNEKTGKGDLKELENISIRSYRI